MKDKYQTRTQELMKMTHNDRETGTGTHEMQET